MTKKQTLMYLANKQIDYMLAHNGTQSLEIHDKAEKVQDADKTEPFFIFTAWRRALANRSKKDKVVAEELERMYAWDCWL